MKVIKCDACNNIVKNSDAATITIKPLNLSHRFEFANRDSSTVVEVESFDLCKDCLCKSLRKYYGEHFGKGCDGA